MASGQRIAELDVLRVTGMISVLLGHLPAYFPHDPFLGWIYYAFTSLGVALFVFVSGFVLAQGYAGRKDFHFLRFLGKRLARLYILYIPALILFIVEFYYLEIYHTVNLTPFVPSLLAHLFAGQVLLFPWVRQLFTLWYVGLIVFLYLFFGFLALCKNTYQAIAVIALTSAILLFCRLVLGIIDIRLFLYYPVFLFGVFLGRRKVSLSSGIGHCVGLSALVLGVASYGLFRATGLAVVRGTCNNQPLGCVPSLALVEVYVLSGLVFLLWLSSRGAKRMSKEVSRIVFRMAVASYAVYLFHRPVLAAVWWLGESVIELGQVGKIIAFPIVVVGLFVAGYYIQQGANRILGKPGN
jgi:peptidoglycan/LPS O-acetylase OafA/YrhL